MTDAAAAYNRGRLDERSDAADWVRWPPGRPSTDDAVIKLLGSLADGLERGRHAPARVLPIDERITLTAQLEAANDRVRQLERYIADHLLMRAAA